MFTADFNLGHLFLYSVPILSLLLFNKSINRHFRSQHLRFKLPDLLVPYLLVGIHFLSLMTFGFSVFPYFLIILFSLAIVILLVTAYKKGEIIYGSFFKTYWRFIFLFSFVLYYVLVGANALSFFSG